MSQTLTNTSHVLGVVNNKIVSNLNLICQTTKLNDLPIFPIVQ